MRWFLVFLLMGGVIGAAWVDRTLLQRDLDAAQARVTALTADLDAARQDAERQYGRAQTLAETLGESQSNCADQMEKMRMAATVAKKPSVSTATRGTAAVSVPVNTVLRRFADESGQNAGQAHSDARPKASGKTAFFPRSDRPYGLEREALQTHVIMEDASDAAFTNFCNAF